MPVDGEKKFMTSGIQTEHYPELENLLLHKICKVNNWWWSITLQLYGTIIMPQRFHSNFKYFLCVHQELPIKCLVWSSSLCWYEHSAKETRRFISPPKLAFLLVVCERETIQLRTWKWKAISIASIYHKAYVFLINGALRTVLSNWFIQSRRHQYHHYQKGQQTLNTILICVHSTKMSSA